MALEDLERAQAEAARIASATLALEAKRERLLGPEREMAALKSELDTILTDDAIGLRRWIDNACDGERPELPSRAGELEARIAALGGSQNGTRRPD